MPPQKQKGHTLLEAADKRVAKSGSWFFAPSSTAKWEEAGDMYQSAANAFKLDKLFKEAGDAYAREAECREQDKQREQAANAWWNAAQVYQRAENYDLAILAFSHAITFLTDAGRFRQAADREHQLAKLYLIEGKQAKACESYERAGEWYEMEGAPMLAISMFKEVGNLQGELENYADAIAKYEKVAEMSRGVIGAKFQIKGYWLRAGLCTLAMNDTVAVRRVITKYVNQDSTFKREREYRLLEELANQVDAHDEDGFANVVSGYETFSELDNWTVGILLKIRRSLKEEVSML